MKKAPSKKLPLTRYTTIIPKIFCSKKNIQSTTSEQAHEVCFRNYHFIFKKSLEDLNSQGVIKKLI